MRANKAKGIQSQKQLREEAHERFNAEVKELAFECVDDVASERPRLLEQYQIDDVLAGTGTTS